MRQTSPRFAFRPSWYRTRLAMVLGLAALGPASGCGGQKDCAAEQDDSTRDWCWFEQATGAAKKNSLGDAVTSIQQIQDPMVKSSAIDKVIFAGPDGLDQTTVQNLCNQVEQPYTDTCMRTWNRPHLWEK